MDDINTLEEIVFQIDIIKSFEERGWALYECPGALLAKHDLKCIVELGRETQALKYNIKYILLPLNQADSDWKIIESLSRKVIQAGRGPYFVEFETIDDQIYPIGRFLIDSVELNPPFLLLHIDRRMSNVRYPDRYDVDDNVIELHLSELWKIRKQLMMALRN